MTDDRVSSPPAPMRRSRKAVYVIPSLLTTANIFCGFYSVMESIRAISSLGLGTAILGLDGVGADPSGPAMTAAIDHFDRAAITIGFAALFDLLDGRVARMTNTTSEFGIELDS